MSGPAALRDTLWCRSHCELFHPCVSSLRLFCVRLCVLVSTLRGWFMRWWGSTALEAFLYNHGSPHRTRTDLQLFEAMGITTVRLGPLRFPLVAPIDSEFFSHPIMLTASRPPPPPSPLAFLTKRRPSPHHINIMSPLPMSLRQRSRLVVSSMKRTTPGSCQ